MKYIKSLIRVSLVLSLVFTGHVYARMYQWTDPDSGSTQLSGKPPAWYRSANGGPRVFVFENGRLIDDTSIEVADEVRHRMRQRAFVLVEKDKQQAQEKLTRARQLKEQYEVDVEDSSPLPDSDDLLEAEREEDIEVVYEENKEEQATETDENIEMLRKVISDWEKAQTEKARQALD